MSASRLLWGHVVKKASPLLLAFLLSGACAVAGCAADPAATGSQSESATSAGADELTAQAEADAVVVAADSLTFPGQVAKTHRVNDLYARTVKKEVVYLAGGRATNAVLPDGSIDPTAKNPNGYLRKVTGVELLPNGDTKFLTQPASLTEARGALLASGTFKAQDSGDCFPQATNPFNLYNIDLSRTLYAKQFGSIGAMKIALKNTNLTIDGNLDTGVAGSCWGPDAAHALLTLNLKGQATLEGAFDGAFGAETGTKELYHKQIAITSVLGYPLALDLTVSAECEFESTGKAVADVGVTLNGSVTGGGQWDSSDGFSTVFRPTWPKASVIGPSFSSNASVGGKCTLVVNGKALIFDSTDGPYAQASVYLQLDGTGTGSGAGTTAGGQVEAKLTTGVDAKLGGSLRPFSYTIIDNIDAPLFHQDWELFDKTFSVATP